MFLPRFDNHSSGKSKAFKKWFTNFFVYNRQYFRAFQTSKRDWKSFHMIILKKVKFKWSTLGRCSQDEIFPFAIIRILKEKTKRLQNDSGNKSNRRWSTPSLVNRFQPQSIYYSAVYVLLSFITSLGNSLIFVGQSFHTAPYFIMHTVLCYKKTIAQTIDYLWDYSLCFQEVGFFFFKSLLKPLKKSPFFN